MTKPVNYDELHWRIDALLHRAKIASSQTIRIGGISMKEASCTVSKENTRIEIPPKEFALLYKLLSYPGIVFTKHQLLDDIWGYDSERGEETLKIRISRLRNRVRKFTEFRIIAIVITFNGKLPAAGYIFRNLQYHILHNFMLCLKYP